MKMKYFSYYVGNHYSFDSRYRFLAADNKIEYIVKTINALGVHVDIISFAQSSDRKSIINFNHQTKKELNDKTTLKLFFSIGSKFFIVRAINKLLSSICLITYILLNVRRNEKIIVYHSLGYTRIFLHLKKIIKFFLILEIEEVYADITGKLKDRKKENRLFNSADAFIFSTDLLAEIVNIAHKPYAVVYGTYIIENNRNFRFDDDLIHVVYAGTLDPRKGGSAAAAAAAIYLDNSFHIHILGFGSKENLEQIKNQISIIQENSTCLITFEGVLCGEDFIKFIQACDIGLSTQNPDAAFNATSFPSKILTYLANGLKVVSIRIPAIENSSLGNILYYYDEQTPQKIAEAIILATKSQSNDNRIYLSKLDNDFKQSLRSLLSD